METIMTALVAINVAVYGCLVMRSLHRIEERLRETGYRLPYVGFERVAKHAERYGHGDSCDR